MYSNNSSTKIIFARKGKNMLKLMLQYYYEVHNWVST